MAERLKGRCRRPGRLGKRIEGNVGIDADPDHDPLTAGAGLGEDADDLLPVDEDIVGPLHPGREPGGFANGPRRGDGGREGDQGDSLNRNPGAEDHREPDAPAGRGPCAPPPSPPGGLLLRHDDGPLGNPDLREPQRDVVRGWEGFMPADVSADDAGPDLGKPMRAHRSVLAASRPGTYSRTLPRSGSAASADSTAVPSGKTKPGASSWSGMSANARWRSRGCGMTRSGAFISSPP